jgi:long-chain acyl-CoA synthetase
MIITGGLNVYPAEIENILLQHRFIAEASAFGVPEKARGQVIKVAVVLVPGKVFTEKELISFCRQRLTGYKVPKGIEFRQSLPKTSIGKVVRRLIANL